MTEQRQRAKADAAGKKTGNADISVFARVLEQAGRVSFTGYDEVAGDATVVGLIVDGASVPSAGAGYGGRGRPGPDAVLRRGRRPARRQRRDHGSRAAAPGTEPRIEVTDVQAPVPGLIVHRGTVTAGEIVVGAPVHAEIDIERRRAISRSHTATHLVHRAFRGALGESAAQAGSENAPGRFRFDFTAHRRGAASVLHAAEEEVNQVLINDLEVRAFHTSIDEARAMGALALFGEKYGDTGARRRGRRLLARAVRRHARGQVRQPRAGQDPGRVVDRVRRPPGRGAGRASTRSSTWPGRACWSAS